MNLTHLLAERVASGDRIGVALIGAGKFGSMFLAQVPHIDGLDVVAIVDLQPDKARRACLNTGWSEELLSACLFTDDYTTACAHGEVCVVIEATGDPTAGVVHALYALQQGRHVVMVNVEADVLAGPVLAQRARSAGVVYTMAYGDQPALIAEMIDWARACGFHVTAAGKGTKYLPAYHEVTPDEVWPHYGLTEQTAREAGMNPQMFNSFLDGTKSAIEMAAVANACELHVPPDGLLFPPCEVDDLAGVLCPESAGGVLAESGSVEVVSCVRRNGDALQRDLRWGVYVVLEAPNDYAAACFQQYGLKTDASGRYAAQFKPYHLIGLELSVSVLNAELRGEPTGCSTAFRGDVVSVTKRDLQPGVTLDGEGGYTVWGKLLPAETSVGLNALPIGLAHGCQVTRPLKRGQIVTFRDIAPLPESAALQLRAEMCTAV